MTLRSLRRWFNTYNQRHFSGKLEAQIAFDHLAQDDAAKSYPNHKVIILSDTLSNPEWQKIPKFILVHEMVHLWAGERVNHGPKFQRKMLSILKKEPDLL